MTTIQSQLVDLAQRNQKTASQFVQSWTTALQDYGMALTHGTPGALPTAEEIVNSWFDLAEQILRIQREYAVGIVTATSEVAEAAWQVAENAAKTAATSNTTFDNKADQQRKVRNASAN